MSENGSERCYLAVDGLVYLGLRRIEVIWWLIL